jgi:hypothetical protein
LKQICRQPLMSDTALRPLRAMPERRRRFPAAVTHIGPGPVSRLRSFAPLDQTQSHRMTVAPQRFAASAAVAMPATASLAKLLASHILRDGEVVLLVLRPSLWFLLLSCIQFIGVALVLTILVRFLNIQNHATTRSLIEFGVSAISARLVWATLQWISRLYILTDLRIISIAGVFQMQIFDCPLRKIVRTRITRTNTEWITSTGSIEIVPQDESSAFGEWKTIAHPIKVHETIVATINRAKQGNCGPSPE